MTRVLKPARVGIVVRTKNRPWFLQRALNDIARQDVNDYVVQIVNDGGDPQAVDAIVADLPEELSTRVNVIHHATARGRSAAANAGITTLDTSYVVLHDDDDLWHPSFLRSTVTWLDNHPDDVGVVSRTEIVYEVKRGDEYFEVDRAAFWPQLVDFTYSRLLEVNRAVPIAFLYRRKAHEVVGPYREDLHSVEDWDFYLRLLVDHHVSVLPGIPLAYWMQRVSARGDEGNSVFALADDHIRYDHLVRDDALRAYVRESGPGLPLYLTAFVQQEIARQLEARSPVISQVVHRLRALRHRKRAR